LRIVVRAHDARLARDAQALLAAAGIEASALAGAYRPAPDGEDIVIAPVGPDLSVATELAQAVLGGDRPPLAVIAGLAAEAPFPAGLQPHATFAGAVALDASPKLLGAQVGAWIRAALADDERGRRARTAAGLMLTPPKPVEPRPLRALYIGAPSAAFLSLEHAFKAHAGDVTAAFYSFTGFDQLHDEVFDAVVLNGAQDAATAISLCAALRRNASLYHLPTLVVTAPGDAKTGEAAIERSASAVVSVNEPYAPSLGWLFEAVRRERRRRGAEHEIQTLRDMMGDPRTGLFLRGAFDAQLAQLAGDHHVSGRPLSLAALRVLPAHGARQPSEAIWKRGFNEIASLSARLMRETDSGASIGGDFIAVAMPATRLEGAKRTAERIASVAECTAFASGEGGAGPLVFEQSAVELQPGESGAGMLARALRALDAESIPA
jgi:two-component system cell cycle response regulator PopA